MLCLFDQEKLERLYELDRMLQEQSFKVTSLQEDKVSCCCLLLLLLLLVVVAVVIVKGGDVMSTHCP